MGPNFLQGLYDRVICLKQSKHSWKTDFEIYRQYIEELKKYDSSHIDLLEKYLKNLNADNNNIE